jgi:hypothetical protein
VRIHPCWRCISTPEVHIHAGISMPECANTTRENLNLTSSHENLNLSLQIPQRANISIKGHAGVTRREPLWLTMAHLP